MNGQIQPESDGSSLELPNLSNFSAIRYISEDTYFIAI